MKGRVLPTRILARTVSYLRANSLGAVALFVALGGTGYATVGLHTHAATTRHPALTAHGQVVAWALVNGNGHVVAGSPRPHVVGSGLPGVGGFYRVTWRGVPTSHKRNMYCATTANVDGQFSAPDTTWQGQPAVAGYAVVDNRGHFVDVTTWSPAGVRTPLGFELTLVCPVG